MLKQGNRFTLFAIFGALVLVLSACANAGPVDLSTADLANTRWELDSMGEAGAASPVVEGTNVTLEIGPDGEIVGSGGCNSYSGEFRIEGDRIVVSDITSTLMACTDEQVMQQEEQFFAALENASGFELRGDELVILYNNGESELVFSAAP